jgi:hypothetical protein
VTHTPTLNLKQDTFLQSRNALQPVHLTPAGHENPAELLLLLLL